MRCPEHKYNKPNCIICQLIKKVSSLEKDIRELQKVDAISNKFLVELGQEYDEGGRS